MSRTYTGALCDCTPFAKAKSTRRQKQTRSQRHRRKETTEISMTDSNTSYDPHALAILHHGAGRRNVGFKRLQQRALDIFATMRRAFAFRKQDLCGGFSNNVPFNALDIKAKHSSLCCCAAAGPSPLAQRALKQAFHGAVADKISSGETHIPALFSDAMSAQPLSGSTDIHHRPLLLTRPTVAVVSRLVLRGDMPLVGQLGLGRTFSVRLARPFSGTYFHHWKFTAPMDNQCTFVVLSYLQTPPNCFGAISCAPFYQQLKRCATFL